MRWSDFILVFCPKSAPDRPKDRPNCYFLLFKSISPAILAAWQLKPIQKVTINRKKFYATFSHVYDGLVFQAIIYRPDRLEDRRF